MSEKTEIKKSVCTWCKGECGVLLHVKDGRLIKAEDDPDWPRKGFPPTKACPKFMAAIEWFYHPDRVNFPLKRAGERGEGKWNRISWDQAFTEIADKLIAVKDKYGAESIAFTRGTSYRTEANPINRFFLQLGSPMNSISAGNVCMVPRSSVAFCLVGMYPHYSVRPTTKCIVLLGAEPANARPITYNNMRKAIKNGAKLIIVDPRRTGSAVKSDIWLRLRPGTDTALLMSMVNVIIKEGLYDREFVEKWCHGFDKLVPWVEQFNPEEMAGITEVPAEKVREAARLYAATRPGAMVEGMGVEQQESCYRILHARWILAALTGNIDIEGGEELIGPNTKLMDNRSIPPVIPVDPELRKKQIGADRFKLLTFPGRQLITPHLKRVWGKVPELPLITQPSLIVRAILNSEPYPVRAMFTVISNPLATIPNIKLLYKALRSLDLYVVMDFWLTPCAEIADYILPPASWMERPMLWDFNGFAAETIGGEAAVPATIPGEYEHKTDYEIFKGISQKLGLGEYWPWKTLEEYYDTVLEPWGVTHKEFVHKIRCYKKVVDWRKYEKVGFATPTGKVELYSTVFEQLGYDPLPKHVEPSETRVSKPDLVKEYPLTLLTGGRVRPLYHSEWRQIESVRRLHPYPLMDIHPDMAARLGIKNGDWVWIETLRGRVKHKAKLFDGMATDVVHAEHAWWLPEMPGEEPWLRGAWEMNANVLTDDDPDKSDPAVGATPERTMLCKVYPVKNYKGKVG